MLLGARKTNSEIFFSIIVLCLGFQKNWRLLPRGGKNRPKEINFFRAKRGEKGLGFRVAKKMASGSVPPQTKQKKIFRAQVAKKLASASAGGGRTLQSKKFLARPAQRKEFSD